MAAGFFYLFLVLFIFSFIVTYIIFFKGRNCHIPISTLTGKGCVTMVCKVIECDCINKNVLYLCVGQCYYEWFKLSGKGMQQWLMNLHHLLRWL